MVREQHQVVYMHEDFPDLSEISASFLYTLPSRFRPPPRTPSTTTAAFHRVSLEFSRNTGYSMRLLNFRITHAFLPPWNTAQTFVPARRVWSDGTLASSQSPPTLCSLLRSCLYSDFTVCRSFPCLLSTGCCLEVFGDMWLPPAPPDGALLFDTLLESSSVFWQLHVGWASMIYSLPLFAWYLSFTLSPQS